MYIYHGTNKKSIPQILKYGIRSRSETGGENRWGEFPSRKDMVYLSTHYAPYFASNKCGEEDHPTIIRIKMQSLVADAMYPDEDFIAFRLQDEPGLKTLAEKTEWARKNLLLLQEYTQDSLEYLGNIAYQGTVFPDQIDQIITFDPKSNPAIFNMSLDPTITIMNKFIMGNKYKMLSEWFFEEKSEKDFEDVVLISKPDERTPKEFHRIWDSQINSWSKRSGITKVLGV